MAVNFATARMTWDNPINLQGRWALAIMLNKDATQSFTRALNIDDTFTDRFTITIANGSSAGLWEGDIRVNNSLSTDKTLTGSSGGVGDWISMLLTGDGPTLSAFKWWMQGVEITATTSGYTAGSSNGTLNIGARSGGSSFFDGSAAYCVGWDGLVPDLAMAQALAAGALPWRFATDKIVFQWRGGGISEPARVGHSGFVTPGTRTLVKSPMLHARGVPSIIIPAAAPAGRIMASLAGSGGLAHKGGMAGIGGGLAG